MESGLIILGMLLAAGNPFALAGDDSAFVLAGGDEEQNKLDHRAVLVFHASWCGPCGQMDQTTYPPLKQRGWRVSNYGAATDREPHVVLIDVDKHPDLMKRFRVTELPTIVSWTGRSEQARRTGYLDAYGIGNAWNSSGEKASARTVQPQQTYRARWTFPGETREELIEHLSGPNHNYTRESLNRLPTSRLYQLHDEDHDGVRAKPKQQGWSLPFIQFQRG